MLITGWFSFLDGEATAGDVGAAAAVAAALDAAGTAHDTAWSPVFRPRGPALVDADPDAYDALVFVCGPVHGHQVRALHERFARCLRIAVGVSVVDPRDPAVRGFHRVLPRDAPGAPARPDLAAAAPPAPGVPVVGVTAAPDQPEYARRSAHETVHARLAAWLAAKDCARVPLDTRLDGDDWFHCATPGQYDALVRRVDAVVTTRLHGLVLALRNGVPAIAVDPVAGGAKVTAQAAVWGWPVVTLERPGDPLPEAELDGLWRRWLGPGAADPLPGGAPAPAHPPLVRDLLDALGRDVPPGPLPGDAAARGAVPGPRLRAVRDAPRPSPGGP